MKRLALLALLLPGLAMAADLELRGFVDARFVAPPDEEAGVDGGLGKTRYGGGDDALVKFGGAVVEGHWQALPSLFAFADVQLRTDDETTVEVLEAYLRWRPVSTRRWRSSLKVGAFYPEISLENNAVGWTSSWTLTPSAINTWVGEELRTIGGEYRIEHRGTEHTLEAALSLYQASDPAGELIAARGWSLSDLSHGLGGRVREPDVFAEGFGNPTPRRYDPFEEFDHRIGWLAELTWRAPALGRATLLRYDNRADPAAHDSGANPVYAWYTEFTSLALQTQLGPVTLIAQGMSGYTTIQPTPSFSSETEFGAGFLLVGWELGAWQPALRVDSFSTRPDPPSERAEHGSAVTAALSWRPRDGLRLTAEVIRVDSVRAQREADGLPARSRETQAQLGVRVFF